MSVEIVATIICDGCGFVVVGSVQKKSSTWDSSYRCAKKEILKLHWLIQERYYRSPKHFCHACADSAPKKLKLAADH